MSDFCNLALDEVLPKKNAKCIEMWEEPKKTIDPALAARLQQKQLSPPKTARNEAFIRKIWHSPHYTCDGNTVTDDDWEVIGQRLEDVLPQKPPAVLEIIDEAKRPIEPTLALRLGGQVYC